MDHRISIGTRRHCVEIEPVIQGALSTRGRPQVMFSGSWVDSPPNWLNRLQPLHHALRATPGGLETADDQVHEVHGWLRPGRRMLDMHPEREDAKVEVRRGSPCDIRRPASAGRYLREHSQ